jgi:hypothetical protein
MREEDREILEEAVNRSAGGEDFDEMLLRATKKHLPMKYLKHFHLMLEEVLKEADERGVTNRQAAQGIIRRLPAPENPPPAPAERHPAPAPAGDQTEQIIARHLRQQSPPRERAPGPDEPGNGEGLYAPSHGDGPAGPKEKEGSDGPKEKEGPAGHKKKEGPGEQKDGEGQEDSVEKLPETQKIVDLGGTHPESLPPELQDKLKKLVKAQKKKQAWEEGAPADEPEPGLFFKGRERAPPVVPLKRPEKKPEEKTAGAVSKETGEVDLESHEDDKVKVRKVKKR